MSFDNGQIYQDSGGTYYKISFDNDVLEAFDIAVITKSESLPVGLVPTRVVQENDKSMLCYVVTSLLRYKDFTKRFEITLKEQFELIQCVLELYERLDDLLLDPCKIIFEKEHVYYDTKRRRFAFLYNPSIETSKEDTVEKKILSFIKEFCLYDCKVKLESDESYEIGFDLMNWLKCEGVLLEQIKEVIERGAMKKEPRIVLETTFEETTNESWVNAVARENQNELAYKESAFYMKMNGEEGKEKNEKNERNEWNEGNEGNEAQKSTTHGFNRIKSQKNIKKGIIFLMSFIVGILMLTMAKKIDVINLAVIMIISLMSPYVILKRFSGVDSKNTVDETLELNGEIDGPLETRLNLENDSNLMLHMNQDVMLEKAKKHAFHVQPAYETQLMPIASIHYRLMPSKNTYPTIMITTKSTLVGRAESLADYVLDSTTIGRLHAEIIYENGTLSIRDFNTLNGTYVNENRISANESKIILASDTIHFADIGYKVDQI